jgi:hypothetical protein
MDNRQDLIIEEINIENVFIPHIAEKKVDVKHLSILHYIDLKIWISQNQ